MNRRNLSVLVAVTALVALLVGSGAAVGVSFWLRKHRSPCSEGGGSSYARDRAWQHMGCRVWKTEGDQLFYAIAIAHCDFEPVLPSSLRWSYSYDTGYGKLTVNDRRIEWTGDSRLLALGPFGRMHELALSEDEAAIVASGDEKRIWREVVLKRLYRLEGGSASGKRAGEWVCRDASGRKAWEGSYVDGRRDGEWVYYYPSGEVRARIRYARGSRNGRWTRFDREGQTTEVLTWKDDVPVERPARQVTLGGTMTIRPGGDQAGTIGN